MLIEFSAGFLCYGGQVQSEESLHPSVWGVSYAHVKIAERQLLPDQVCEIFIGVRVKLVVKLMDNHAAISEE